MSVEGVCSNKIVLVIFIFLVIQATFKAAFLFRQLRRIDVVLVKWRQFLEVIQPRMYL